MTLFAIFGGGLLALTEAPVPAVILVPTEVGDDCVAGAASDVDVNCYVNMSCCDDRSSIYKSYQPNQYAKVSITQQI